jgi:multiple sugar transport system substrate-binding protein
MALLSRRAVVQGLLSGATAASAGWLLAACGAARQGAAPGAAPTEGAPRILPSPTPGAEVEIPNVAVQAGQTKVEYWTPRGDKVSLGATLDVLNDYHASQDKIRVQPIFVPTTAGTQMSEKLLTSIAAGTPPETAEFDRFIVASWAAKSSLTDLTDRAAAAKVSSGQYYPFSWEEASYKGKLYAMPFDTDTRGLYYNLDVFKEVGLDPNKPPTTISQLDEYAAKLTKKDGRKFVRWGYSPAFNQSFHFAVGLQYNGEFFDMAKGVCTANEPRIVEAFTWMKSYADKYNIEDMEAFSSAFGTAANNPFLTGQIAIYCNGDWGLTDIKRYKPDLSFGVTPMPGKDGPASCMAGGWSQVLPKGTKRPDEGFSWISYIAGKDGQLKWNLATTHIPTNIEAANDPGFRADPKHALFMDFLKTAKNRPAVPSGQLLWNSLGMAQSDVLHNKKTPKQALDEVTKAVNAEEQKYR